MKRNLLLFVLLVLGLACGAQAPWNGTVAEVYEGGDGTSESPYQIATAEQLALLAYETNNGLGGDACYVLTNDIDLNAADSIIWIPIGNEEKFSGVFDGDGHTIGGMYQDGLKYSGLFAYTENATIKNLRIEKANIVVYVQEYVYSAMAGFISAQSLNTNIIDCFVDGWMGVASTKPAGGLVGTFLVDVGENDTIFIKNCTNNAEIWDNLHLGGLVGVSHVENGQLLVEKCVNNGDLTGIGFTGGIIGDGEFIIRHCHNYGKIFGETTAGGMVGQGGSFGLIEYCINHPSGEVTGGCSAGGIIGTPIFTTIRMSGNMAPVKGQGSDMILVGGIAGSDGSISNCYNTGDLSGELTDTVYPIAQFGGITGSPTEGFVYNVYNAGQITKPTNPNLTNAIYGHIIPAILSDTAIRNCYYYGNVEIPAYVYNASGPSYVYLPGSCAFNEGASATTWTLDETQYGTTDLLDALNAGAMGECIWIEDTEGINRGFPVIGNMDLTQVKEHPVANYFSVYPNPTNGILFVETRRATSLPAANEYRITNLLGQTLQTGSIGGEMHQIDVSGLHSDMYLLTFDGATVKFVVK